jgi:glycogen(starch) synthase
MRVLHVTTEFPPVIYGGLGTAVGGLVNASARTDMTVGVLLIGGALVIDGKIRHAYGSPSDGQNAVVQEGVLTNSYGVEFVQVPWDDAIEPAVRLVREWRPDIVHLHTHWAWPVARAIQTHTDTCLIYTVHSVDRAEYEIGEEGPNLLDRCDDQEAALAAADRVIALTRHERELLTRYYPWVRRDITVVGNGIDELIGAGEAKEKREPNDSVLVLYSGRLVERKGIAELLAAIPQVLARAPTTRFVLVGGPAHWGAADVERQWSSPEISPFRSQIQFTGWLSPEQVAHWYCEADVLVVPSRYEPFGMVVLEGMLHGLPIVAAAAGGPKEILTHGRTGLLFPPKDVNAFAQALIRLIEDPALRKRLGGAAAQNVRRKWLWLRTVKQMRDVYQRALKAHARRCTLRGLVDPIMRTRPRAPGGSKLQIHQENGHA